MRRWHHDEGVMRKKHNTFVSNLKRVGEIEELQRLDKPFGKFRKNRGTGVGCGHAHCRLCHCEKIDGIKPYKTLLNDITFKEEINSL